MTEIYKYDANGNWLPGETRQFGADETLPANFTEKPLPQPNWKPVFKNGAWVETLPESERPAPPAPTPSIEELLAEKTMQLNELRAYTQQLNDDFAALAEFVTNGGM